VTNPVDRLTTALAARYVVERELGQGGMATVYLAHDVRHDRKVALKVLRPELAAIVGIERFLHEIKTTAHLQHPHILPLHDSGEADGIVYYVMPYVEGESLRDRLTREKQLPVEEAVRIAREVADALDYAHRHGVVHRDIKPENILAHDGHVVVADFGIALAVSSAGGGTRLTESGMSLGTPYYMSPEQAMGEREITPKSDVYALACVLYEMLVGEPPFTGPTAQAIIARVVTEEPRRLTLQRRTVPPHVEAAVEKALQKLPADRFATAKEFADALGGQLVAVPAPPPVALAAAPAQRLTWPDMLRQPLTRLLLATLAAVLVGAAATVWAALRTTSERPTVRFTLMFEAGEGWQDATGTPFALSPDGRLLVYRGSRFASRSSSYRSGAHAIPRLYLRPLGELRARELTGTEGAEQPVFSPDGRWLAFYAGGQLWKVPVEGGTPLLLAAVPGLAGLSWGVRDEIAVSTAGTLAVVPAAGGPARVVARPDTAAGETAMRWPLALSDGRTALYTSWPREGDREAARIGIVSLETGTTQVLGLVGTHPLAVVDGMLLYAGAAGAVMATRFDARRHRVVGAPVPVAGGVTVGPGGPLKGAVSESGSAVYATESQRAGYYLHQVTPRGPDQLLLPDARNYGHPRFSPDARHIALAIEGDTTTDVWIFDRPAGPLRRLTSQGDLNDRPEWTPDSRQVLFRSNRSGKIALWIQPVDGHRPAELFFGLADAGVYEGVLSADGEYLIFQRDSTGVAGRSWYRRLRGDTSMKLVAAADAGQQLHGRFSRDGRWVAYSSDELGPWQVYVKPFPALDARHQVSLVDGANPFGPPTAGGCST
jgi:serine/threonine-protein kinase